MVLVDYIGIFFLHVAILLATYLYTKLSVSGTLRREKMAQDRHFRQQQNDDGHTKTKQKQKSSTSLC